eukprot:GHVU01215437.1.p1 GENE.GHVU01215437.1~~GHVU01215437.1.p1  ORF type:complete len:142 (+),score=20.90 GHVU01215437.1:20-445(+)
MNHEAWGVSAERRGPDDSPGHEAQAGLENAFATVFDGDAAPQWLQPGVEDDDCTPSWAPGSQSQEDMRAFASPVNTIAGLNATSGVASTGSGRPGKRARNPRFAVVFVAHSLGGLVPMTLLVQYQGRSRLRTGTCLKNESF